MNLEANRDCFGNPVNLTTDKLRKILDALDEYFGNKKYVIREIRQDNVKDPNDRYDIEVAFPETGAIFGQKLLFLKGELIDGKTFHKRFNEWYGEKEAIER